MRTLARTLASIVAMTPALLCSATTFAQTADANKPATIETRLPDGATPERVSPDEFEKEYALVGMSQTMHSSTYLGQRDGRAYLSHRSKSIVSGKWSDRVIYVDLSELDKKFRDSLPKAEMKAQGVT
ncbi:MAG: formylglycine-generating enzyme family protein, partial [Planctomycetaceae bacterium]|nr:formylglycine-generating enzyme family protein [Planctomycetaceae bacterium]